MKRSTALLLLLAACGDDDPAGECTSDAQCLDAHECTIDTCRVGGVCNHEPVDERCVGGSCSVTSGCIDGMECMADPECNDSIDCTLDSCAVGGVCRNMALNERCDTAMGERCSMTRGCYVPMPCTTPADCNDGVFCNGDEICMPEFGCDSAPMPRMCNDSDDCTVDACDSGMNMCTFTCDTSRPECECPVAAPTCVGRFMLTSTPAPTFACGGGLVDINYDFSTATFARPGTALTITPASAHRSLVPLTDATPPVCPDFEANTTVSGDCVESYTLSGTFTDDDHFTGTLDVTFTGSCFPALTMCTSHVRSVTGTRIP